MSRSMMRGERKYWTFFLLAALALTLLIRHHVHALTMEVRREGLSSVVVVAARNVLIDMVDIETGLRGYLIAGHREFLRPYHEGLGRFHADFAALRSGVNPRSRESVHVDQVAQIAHDVLGEFNNQIEAVEDQSVSAAQKRFGDFPTKPGMDMIRDHLSSIQAEENQHIAQNMRSLEMSMQTTKLLLDGFSFTIFVILVAMLCGIINPPTRPEAPKGNPHDRPQ